MKIFITGICGFVGSSIATSLSSLDQGVEIHGIDNLLRKGSERNRDRLTTLGVRVIHGDVRMQSDLSGIPEVDWVIDASALPNVLAGSDGVSSSRQLVEHNLVGTINLLELCRAKQSGLVLLSTSRVYSIPALASLPLTVRDEAFHLNHESINIDSVSQHGLVESFSTASPVSMYGATKLASEALALEYGATYDFPVWVNRCGVIAGAGQFGHASQGIFAFWINSHLRRRPLKYIGFHGQGHQVRDCLHPSDLARLIHKQINSAGDISIARLVNVGGGSDSATSLRQLTRWCDERFGEHPVVASDEVRAFDLPWVVLDARLAERLWGWRPEIDAKAVFEELACHAEANPDWLDISQ